MALPGGKFKLTQCAFAEMVPTACAVGYFLAPLAGLNEKGREGVGNALAGKGTSSGENCEPGEPNAETAIQENGAPGWGVGAGVVREKITSV